MNRMIKPKTPINRGTAKKSCTTTTNGWPKILKFIIVFVVDKPQADAYPSNDQNKMPHLHAHV